MNNPLPRMNDVFVERAIKGENFSDFDINLCSVSRLMDRYN